MSRRGFLALGVYLAAQERAGHMKVTLAFTTIEATILRRALSAVARLSGRHRSWWYAEASAYHVWYGWRSGGWLVEEVDLVAETVTFARSGGAA